MERSELNEFEALEAAPRRSAVAATCRRSDSSDGTRNAVEDPDRSGDQPARSTRVLSTLREQVLHSDPNKEIERSDSHWIKGLPRDLSTSQLGVGNLTDAISAC